MVKDILQSIIRLTKTLLLPLYYWSKRRMDHGDVVWITTINAMTIKDKFPIPLVEDLLDELHHAHSFLNLTYTRGIIKLE